MFERYSEKAHRAVFFARYEANRIGSQTIESEHIFLSLMSESAELATRLGVPHQFLLTVRGEIEQEKPHRQNPTTSIEMLLSEESKRILDYAIEEADRMGSEHVEAEHLLLGILREKDCYAARLLSKRGINLAEAREKLAESGSRDTCVGEMEFPSPPAAKGGTLLSEFLDDIGHDAVEGKLDPIIGRETQLERVIEILCLRSRNNPVLVGEPGVGKSALVEGLALRIADGDVPERLADKRIVTFDLGSLVAVLSATRRYEERVKASMQELECMAGVIVYIEGLFAGGRTLGLPRVIKPLLDRGAIQCIAAALPAEHHKWMEREAWLKEYFYSVEIPPPDENDAIRILLTIKNRYEQFHGVTYSEESLKHAVFYSEKFLPKGHLPDKAIDLIDDAGAAVAVRRSGSSRHGNGPSGPNGAETVGVEEIEDVLSRWTNIPLEKIRKERRKA